MSSLISKIQHNLKLIYKELVYTIRNQFSNETIVKKENPSIIVSLTTFNKRIDKVFITIETLFEQEIKPERIILWLSLEEFPNKILPKSLERLTNRGLDIRFVNENLRSYKKLIYTKEEFPDAIILTADDDVYYPKNWYGDFVRMNQQYPNYILCGRGHYLMKKEVNQLYSYNEMYNKTEKGYNIGYNLMPTGVSGILYPKNALNSVVLDKKLLLELAPLADDIWFKACGLLNDTQSMRIYDQNKKYLTRKDGVRTGLANQNVGKNMNDVQLKAVFDYFSLYDKIK